MIDPISVPKKRCLKCLGLKPITRFGRRTASKDGLTTWCLLCTGSQWTSAQRNSRRYEREQYERESKQCEARREADEQVTNDAFDRLAANRAEVLGR